MVVGVGLVVEVGVRGLGSGGGRVMGVGGLGYGVVGVRGVGNFFFKQIKNNKTWCY